MKEEGKGQHEIDLYVPRRIQVPAVLSLFTCQIGHNLIFVLLEIMSHSFGLIMKQTVVTI